MFGVHAAKSGLKQFNKGTNPLFVNQRLPEFVFGHATLEPEIFNHRTINTTQIW
jgi:hypothetical protein